MRRRRLINYVSPPPGAFWWVDHEEGTAVLIGERADAGEGPVLCYLEQAFDVLRALHPPTLPRFAEVLLAFALTDRRHERLLGAIDAHLQATAPPGGEADARSHRYSATLARAQHLATGLPAEVRVGQARFRIVVQLLSHAHNRYPQDFSLSLLRQLAGWREAPWSHHVATPQRDGLDVALEAARVALGYYADAAELVRRAERLHDLPEVDWAERLPGPGLAADDAVPADRPDEAGGATAEPEDLDRLLADLERARPTRDVAFLVPYVQAGLTTQLRRAERERLRAGGVSDVTNRGRPEALLLTEHAHDPDAFAVRVATGQALYLEREAPPRPTDGVPLLAIDASLRTWGTPRLIAYAIGVALRLRAGERGVEAYALGRRAVRFEADTRAQWVDALALRSTAAHPAAALAEVLAIAQAARRGVTLVTTPWSARSLAVGTVARRFDGVAIHLITAAADGTVHSYHRQGAAQRRLGGFAVDLATARAAGRRRRPDLSDRPAAATERERTREEVAAANPLTSTGRALVRYYYAAAQGQRPGRTIRFEPDAATQLQRPTSDSDPVAARLLGATRLGYAYVVHALKGGQLTGLLCLGAKRTPAWWPDGREEPIPLAGLPARDLAADVTNDANVAIGAETVALVFPGRETSHTVDASPRTGRPAIVWKGLQGFEIDGDVREVFEIAAQRFATLAIDASPFPYGWASALQRVRRLSIVGADRGLALNGHLLHLREEPALLDPDVIPGGVAEFDYYLSGKRRHLGVAWDNGTKVLNVDDGVCALVSRRRAREPIYVHMRLGQGVCLAAGRHWTGSDRLVRTRGMRYLPPARFQETYLEPFTTELAATDGIATAFRRV